jgi:hypothetical protein
LEARHVGEWDAGEHVLQVAAGLERTYFVLGQFIVGNGYCRFTFEGSKTNFRAAAKVGGSSGSDRVAVPAQ